MPDNMKRYGLEAVNCPKETKSTAKEFCQKHGLVFSKFVDLAIKDRMKKVGRLFAEMDKDII